ncbi:hypothetical protein AALO_G00077610 [Alosa alosa]|uniref:Scaffolding anchor of CK1 domain-containing protein n=1 Tax=Alosa alosa TaxID=278164 RepID=A0AAV6H068_9TELE|nr:protein FAM83G isoform X1 [Alosa alosa]KAG5279421.1 hypothetical protein AALO_G00077610 [Alosa alosa]
MALSQIQCMDNEHINPRITESKPEFLYSEEQRIALETLFQDGPAAYAAYLKAQDMRGFLSDHELEYLTTTVTVYNPGGITGHTQINEAGEDSNVPSEYWPDRSDHSLCELELGWPDVTAYRGVTRATVYAHPPMDGQPHIKEVIRKTITQAQKVIGIVMDLFTDVDIFKDLLDMSYRRRVAVYILLDATGVPHFLQMCQRAGMHKGHLKNLRVTCTRGTEFYTRSSKKVCGVVSQKFMFVDGDKSVSGSYSYTWTASRLDRSVVTMLTGQAVETFDRLFRDLYFTSGAVNLSSVKLDEEPEVEPLQQSIQNPQVAAALARKMYSAKYALVSNSSLKSTGTYSGRNSSGNAKQLPKYFRQPRLLEEPRIHPGLVDMQRANMMNYLPTWPEPDPPSDVIGIINIRDSSKPFQAHLMRSELFETSQAIRFKEPFHMPEEPLPEKATPRSRLELADLLSSVQPLKTKGEGLRIADLIAQAPLRPQHDQDSVLTPPIGNPRMVPLNVINECESDTAGVNGDKEPQGPKDLHSAPGCGAKPEQPRSTASNKPNRGTEGPDSDTEKTRAMDTGIDRTDSKSNVNDSRAQSAKNSSMSDKHVQCNGNVPVKSKSSVHVNGPHTHSENAHIRNGNQQTDKKHTQSSNTAKETTILSMTIGDTNTKSKQHKCENNNLNGINNHQNGMKEPILSQPPISGQNENSTQKTELQNNHLWPEDTSQTGTHLNPKIGQKQDMVERHVNHLKAERNGTASVVSQNEYDENSLRAKEKASQQTLQERNSKLEVMQQDLGSQCEKAGSQLNSSELKERKEETELTSNNKRHALSAKEGKNTCQDTQLVPEEVLFISEEDDEQKEMSLAVQNKPRGLEKKKEQAAVPDVWQKRSDSSPKSKRDQAMKTEGKHSGQSNGKVESTTTTMATATTRSNTAKQVDRKGHQQLSHGITTCNLAASKVRHEAGRQLREKVEKSHYTSTPDIARQLKAESRSGACLQVSRKEGCQTPAPRDKPGQERDRDLQERNAQGQARPKTESDGKKLYRASPNPGSRTPLASRTEGPAKSPAVKPDSTPATAMTTTPVKSSSKYFQGKVFSSTKTSATSALPPDQVASTSTASLDRPELVCQVAGQANSPVGQYTSALDKLKHSNSTSKSPLLLQRLLPLRSLKERMTRTPSQKKLTTVGVKDAV